jgi:hypothetical protein
MASAASPANGLRVLLRDEVQGRILDPFDLCDPEAPTAYAAYKYT